MVYDISMGVRRDDLGLRRRIDLFLERGDDGPGDANVLGSRLTNLADWRRSEGTKSRQEASGVTVTVSEMPQRCSRSFAVALEMATTPAAASALARAHLE